MTPKQARDARRKLRTPLLKRTRGDLAVARRCADIIHGPVCAFVQSETPARRFRKSYGEVVHDTRRGAARPTVASLERLERTAKSADLYLWEKAWFELSRDTLNAIIAANQNTRIRAVPVWSKRAPSPEKILPLIPRAKDYIRELKSRERRERNDAVTAVMLAYAVATDSKPTLSPGATHPTRKFISEIEAVYAEVLPNGFGIAKNKKALALCISRALAKLPAMKREIERARKTVAPLPRNQSAAA